MSPVWIPSKLKAIGLSASVLALVFAFDAHGRGQVEPIYSRGAAGLLQLLQRLTTTASVLYTGAHPDDEDSALIARLARGDHARVAYLSLTRGDGGQNVIGAELFEALGVIRTEELLQARRLDGGEQLFARAFDFGFSKRREEAAERWGEEAILGDMVRAIRLFRPMVVISGFTGTPDDGHGHHQFAGYLTPLAFRQAGDPTRFPEHMAEGLRPWQPLKLYVSGGFGEEPAEGMLRIETGAFDPVLGRSYFEIAMEGRSQHKSQDMGALELRGPRFSEVRLVESRAGSSGPEKHMFDGIDTSLPGIRQLIRLPAGLIDEPLAEAQDSVQKALADFDPLAPERIVGVLGEGLRAVRTARETLSKTSSLDAQARYDADFLLRNKEDLFLEAIRDAAGIVVDAVLDSETVVRGGDVDVSVKVFHPNLVPVSVRGVQIRVPAQWQVEASPKSPSPAAPGRRSREESASHEASFQLTVPADAPVTEPYWLREPRAGDTFAWTMDDPKNLPFAPPLAEAVVLMDVDGVSISARKGVEYRYADPTRGELRRELNVVPELSVSAEPRLIVVRSEPSPRRERVAVRIVNETRKEITGTLRLQLPQGWRTVPPEAPFHLMAHHEGAAVPFEVEIPGRLSLGRYQICAQAWMNGSSLDQEMTTIAYPHIQTHRLYVRAETVVEAVDFDVADVRVGYIMGSGDEVPEAIQRMGLPVTLLEEEDLTTGDLTRFDTVVVGVRASEVRQDFVANHGRILDFVRQGGTLIVQYQRPVYAEKNLLPYPAKMSRPGQFSNYRITDESARVTILQPENPIFRFPNRITSSDWDGWVQERSLYHLTDLDSRYQPLVEAADPGEEPHRGGMVYAEVGEGRYVYTAYAFFRQLPEGVPGAYRLFANLLSLPKAPR